jgi:hypothetical protein
MCELTSLATLDLSYNNLAGRVPPRCVQSFDDSSFGASVAEVSLKKKDNNNGNTVILACRMEGKNGRKTLKVARDLHMYR